MNPPPTYVPPASTPPPGHGRPPGPAGQPRKSLPPWAIVGIVIGGLVAVCCVGAVVVVATPDASEEGRDDGLAADATESVDAAPSPTAAATATPSPTVPPEPEPSSEPSPTAPAMLTIPDDLVGMNAAIAEDRLLTRGFTNIEFGSVDEADTVVILPQNWTVVSVEPEPGSEVRADSLVILSCTKQ